MDGRGGEMRYMEVNGKGKEMIWRWRWAGRGKQVRSRDDDYKGQSTARRNMDSNVFSNPNLNRNNNGDSDSKSLRLDRDFQRPASCIGQPPLRLSGLSVTPFYRSLGLECLLRKLLKDPLRLHLRLHSVFPESRTRCGLTIRPIHHP